MKAPSSERVIQVREEGCAKRFAESRVTDPILASMAIILFAKTISRISCTQRDVFTSIHFVIKFRFIHHHNGR